MIADTGSRELWGAALTTSRYTYLVPDSEKQPYITTGRVRQSVTVGAIWSRNYLTTSHEVSRSIRKVTVRVAVLPMTS